MDSDNERICLMYKMHIRDGEELLQKLKLIKNTRGVNKLQKKVMRDINFLAETMKNKRMKKEHLVCSNLHFYKAIINEALSEPACEAVLETFLYHISKECQKRLTVDIVSCDGQRWTKVIARKPSALQQIYHEGDNFGRRSIMDQALSYLQASAQNLHLYCSPQIVFSFVNGVPEEMKICLEKKGISVRGETLIIQKDIPSNVLSDSDEEESDINYTFEGLEHIHSNKKNISSVNLCVTTMIAFVSALTNGGSDDIFDEPLLNQQAEWEKVNPVKPLLRSIFEGKELIACATAVEDFKSIIEVVGGEQERERANKLLSRVNMVPDIIYTGLQPSGRIKKRSLVIFGTGYFHRAITVTANKGFVHASQQKGVKFAAITHESRALTESKKLSKGL